MTKEEFKELALKANWNPEEFEKFWAARPEDFQEILDNFIERKHELLIWLMHRVAIHPEYGNPQ